jgi:hypothetical protein
MLKSHEILWRSSVCLIAPTTGPCHGRGLALWNPAITAWLRNQKAVLRGLQRFSLNKACMLRCKGRDGNTSAAVPQKSRNSTPQTGTPQTYLTLARLTGAPEHGQETKPHDFTAA